MKTDVDYDDYLQGKRLYGDDFNEAEIKNWFEDEKESYYNLKSDVEYKYEYHEINKFYGFKFIQFTNKSINVLCFGSARGDEVIPILNKIGNLTLVDSSDSFKSLEHQIQNITFVKAKENGKLDFEDNSFDLITCLGVLHHIPNVSFVFSELVRVLKPGGKIIYREPISSMGDWRKPRKGVTKRERGIPDHFLINLAKSNNLTVTHSSLCFFPPFILFLRKFNLVIGTNSFFVLIDYIFCRIFSWNRSYFRPNFFKKFAPASRYIVGLK